MVYDGVIEGKYVDLRSCTEDDAEFTRAIRLNPKYAKCFPSFNCTLEQQRNWIDKQREKEGDYFFVVYNKKSEKIGTIGIYNIVGEIGEGGRIIIDSDNPFDAAEAQLLVDRFAFKKLGLKKIVGFVLADNKRAISFNKLFSEKIMPPEVDEKGETIVRVYTSKEGFETIDRRVSRMIYN